MGYLENDPNYGYHHNLHLQPSNSNTSDYMNLHIYWDGVFNMGGSSVYGWLVYCSYKNVTNLCDGWNQNAITGNRGALFYAGSSDCPNDGYNCAKLASDNMRTCLYNNAIANCDFYNQGSVQQDFPGINSLLTYKDVLGDPGTLANAFCDAMKAAQYNCSPH